MIKIKRAPCPKVLFGNPKKGTHYNKKEVVLALHNMQYKKCCYCEQIISSEGHSKAVEHFHPKSVYKRKKNDWENLLLACNHCNGSKSDKFPVRLSKKHGETAIVYKCVKVTGSPLLIDPSDPDCDPEKLITFKVRSEDDELLGLPVAVHNNDKGRLTIESVSLDGKHLLQLRKSHLFDLIDNLQNLRRANDQMDKEKVNHYRDIIEMKMNSRSAFAGCIRAFARHYKLEKKYGIKIPS